MSSPEAIFIEEGYPGKEYPDRLPGYLTRVYEYRKPVYVPRVPS